MKSPQHWHPGELVLDRVAAVTLAEQIASHVEGAIVNGVLTPGAKLPSWRDLAAQLGVARGTVKVAYERLVDRRLLVTAGAAGTRVVDPLPAIIEPAASTTRFRLPDFPPQFDDPLVFQMGIPAHDAFPATVWARLHRQAVQATALRTEAADPRGLAELRSAIASHVAIARGLECSPDQIIVTTGYRSGLAMALQAVGATGKQAWIEDPGYPVTRLALEVAGVHPVPVRIDGCGLEVDRALELAPQAALAIVTPGQQAPTGVTLNADRRKALIRWASANRSWIVEDDYLAELHLSGRSTPALAAEPGGDRVIHIGTFSKTIAPMIGLGFVVAPAPLARRLLDVASWLFTPPNAAAQLAVADFLREGHYLRHLRRMRHLYTERRSAVIERLKTLGITTAKAAGLAVIVELPDGYDDRALAERAFAAGLGPAPLSQWYSKPSRSHAGLLLGIANARDRSIESSCRHLVDLIDRPSNASLISVA